MLNVQTPRYAPRSSRQSRRRTPEFHTPLMGMFGRTAVVAMQQADRTTRLTQAANLCESLAKSEPEVFDRLSAEALRWPSRLMLRVLADIGDRFQELYPEEDPSLVLSRSLNFVELWIEALRGAYTDRDALAHDRERSRLALRALRMQMLGEIDRPSAP